MSKARAASKITCAFLSVAVIVLPLLIASCGKSDDVTFRAAEENASLAGKDYNAVVEAYDNYLDDFPDGKHCCRE